MTQAPHTPKRKIGWKLFFWLHAIMLLALFCILAFQLYMLVSLDTSGSHKEIYDSIKEAFSLDWKETLLSYPLMVITTIGLYGFAYDKKIFFRKLWLYVLALYIIDTLYDILTIDLTGSEPNEMFFFFVAIMPLVLTLYILEFLFLYKYSLKSPEIWEQEKP